MRLKFLCFRFNLYKMQFKLNCTILQCNLFELNRIYLIDLQEQQIIKKPEFIGSKAINL